MKKGLSFIHSRVARRIFVLFVICALLPVCVLTLLSLQRVSSRLEKDSQERMRQVTKNAGMTILEGLTLLQSELETMPLLSGDGVRRIPRQATRAEGDKRFRAVTVMTDDGEGVIISGRARRLSPAERAHLTAGNTLILTDTVLGARDSIHMATSLNRNLPRHGLLVGEINPDYLWTLVGYTLPPGINICIIGPSGKPLYASLPLTPALVSLVMSDVKRSSAGHFKWHWENENFLINYWPVFLKPAFLANSWTLIAVQSKQEALEPARSFITTFLLVILLTLFVVIFSSSVLIRRSLVPLSILSEGARRLSSGDFDSRVEIASGDEFEDLAATFNDMSEHLGDEFTRLSEMGRLVQRMLEAHDRDTIIDAFISSFRNSVPCEWLGISLTDGNNAVQILTFYNNCSNGIPTDTVRFESLLNLEELNNLRTAAESLHVSDAQEFTSLLAPMAAEGAGEFYLLPIFIKDRLLGILIIGYRHAPKQIREEVVRARQVADEIAIAMDNVRLIYELKCLNQGTLEVLANTVDAKSQWTAGHSQRVTRLALEIGKEMGLSLRELELLNWGGQFHDIGKIGVPEEILDKPGRLTAEEYATIKDHPRKGAEILKPIQAYHGAIPIVAQHHERFDGQGYPLGLTGEEITLGARILAVADVFDALYSSRPYRPGWEIGRVISYMEENAGSQFDPEVVKEFLKIDRTVYIESPADADLSNRGWISA